MKKIIVMFFCLAALLQAKVVECTYIGTGILNTDFYKCEDGHERSVRRVNLIKNPFPYGTVYACSFLNGWFPHHYDELYLPKPTESFCDSLKKENEEYREKIKQQLHLNDVLREVRDRYIYTCENDFGDMLESSGGIKPTWVNLNFKSETFSSKYSGVCDSCMKSEEPKNGYGCSIVLSSNIPGTDCEKGLTITNKFENGVLSSPVVTSPHKTGKCFNQLKFIEKDREPRKIRMVHFDCNDENSSTSNVYDSKSGTCFKYTMNKALAIRIWNTSDRMPNASEVYIKDCNGQIRKEKLAASGWNDFFVNGTCPVYLKFAGYDVDRGVWKFKEWGNGKIGPTASIVDYKIEWWGKLNDNVGMQKTALNVMSRIMKSIHPVYVEYINSSADDYLKALNGFDDIKNYFKASSFEKAKQKKLSVTFKFSVNQDGSLQTDENGHISCITTEYDPYQYRNVNGIYEILFREKLEDIVNPKIKNKTNERKLTLQEIEQAEPEDSYNKRRCRYNGLALEIPVEFSPNGLQEDYLEQNTRQTQSSSGLCEKLVNEAKKVYEKCLTLKGTPEYSECAKLYRMRKDLAGKKCRIGGEN